MHRVFPFVVPLMVVTFVIAGLIAIGELLLFVGTTAAVPVALGLALGVGFICMLLSIRAAKLPPVRLPGPIVAPPPSRRFDLGAGALVGQYIAIVVAMLLLAFVVLALKH